jgi:hypothetical protein
LCRISLSPAIKKTGISSFKSMKRHMQLGMTDAYPFTPRGAVRPHLFLLGEFQ